MMMRYCEGRAREGGFRGLEMGATLSGVVLYERCGYGRSGKVDVVRCGNGEGIRIVHMVKDLEGWGEENRGGSGEKEGSVVESGRVGEEEGRDLTWRSGWSQSLTS